MNKKIKILLNLVAIKKGGGQQVAVSFLNIILDNEISDLDFFIVATKGTILAKKLLSQNTYKYLLIESNVFKRALFDLYFVRKTVKKFKIDLIFSLFGPPVFARNTISVSGVAVSNIFYPEVKFWHGSLFYLLKKQIIDIYRLESFKKADALIFENSDMKERGKILHELKESIFIRPSISFNEGYHSTDIRNQIKLLNKTRFTILMLTGVHPNKKVEAVIPILKNLHEKNQKEIDFAISISPSHAFAMNLMREAEKNNLQDNIKFIDTVHPEDVSAISQNVDAYLLLSLLESFSNNIIEAWSYKCPLIISEADWSRSICGNAALFVNRDNAKDIADKISILKESSTKQSELVIAGKRELLKYPSPLEKVELQLDYIRRIIKRTLT